MWAITIPGRGLAMSFAHQVVRREIMIPIRTNAALGNPKGAEAWREGDLCRNHRTNRGIALTASVVNLIIASRSLVLRSVTGE